MVVALAEDSYHICLLQEILGEQITIVIILNVGEIFLGNF